MNSTHVTHPTQRGATLIISLLLLMVLTLIGVTAMRTTTLEEKMAGNMRDQNIAFQAAEAALRAGENWLAQQTTEPATHGNCAAAPCDQVWVLNTPNQGDFLDTQWWKATTQAQTYSDATLTDVKTPPQYFVEHYTLIADSLVVGQGPKTGRDIYRITARGTGGTDNAQAILQTTYTRRF